MFKYDVLIDYKLTNMANNNNNNNDIWHAGIQAFYLLNNMGPHAQRNDHQARIDDRLIAERNNGVYYRVPRAQDEVKHTYHLGYVC